MTYREQCFLEEQKLNEFIRTAAYYIWEKRCKSGQEGDPFSDWLEARKWIEENYIYLFLARQYRDPKILYLASLSQEIGNCPEESCGVELGQRGTPLSPTFLKCHACGASIIVTFSEKVLHT